MSVKIAGNSGILAEVDANNKLKVALTSNELTAGYVAIASSSDEGLLTTNRITRSIESTPEYRLRTGIDSFLFSEYFAGTVINTSLWGTPATNSQIAQGSGFITLNSGSSTTSGDGVILRSYKTWAIYPTFPLFCEMLVKIPNLSFNNATAEFGLGLIGVAVGTGCTDGAFFRLTSTGLYCVVDNNGSETTPVLIDATRMSNNGITLTNTNHFIVQIGEDQVIFWINNMIAATIQRVATSTQTSASMQLGIFARQYNSSTNSLSAQQLSIAMITTSNGDGRLDMPFSHRMSYGGNSLFQKYSSYGSSGSTALWNTWVALPNQMVSIAQATYGGTASLGGIQRLGNGGGTVVMSADTAYILYSYQVPALTVSAPIVPAKNLVLTGLKLTCINRGAAGPAGLCTLMYTLMVGCNNVDPKTPEAAATPVKQARPVILGMQSGVTTLPVGAALTPDISMTFDSPITYYPGEFFQITITPMVAYTIGANQELVFTCTPIGYWR